MRHREDSVIDPSERVYEDGPLSLEETKRRLPSPVPCHPNCPGWGVFDSNNYGLHIAVCDECWTGLHDSSRVYDDDVVQLPEAKAELARLIAEEGDE